MAKPLNHLTLTVDGSALREVLADIVRELTRLGPSLPNFLRREVERFLDPRTAPAGYVAVTPHGVGSVSVDAGPTLLCLLAVLRAQAGEA